MANKTIADLVAAGTITGDELLHIVQGGNSRKAALSAIAAAFAGLNIGQGLAAPFRGVLLGRTSALTDFAAPPLLLPWQVADYDTDGFWNAGASTRITIPAGVQKVRFAGQVTITSSATAHGVYLSLTKNGTTDFRGNPVNATRHGSTGFTTNTYALPACPAIPVVAGDYFELRLHLSGQAAAMNDVLVGNYSWLAMEVVQASA